jgi:signal transduction histidine kinase/CheY-like chemotaxis protein
MLQQWKTLAYSNPWLTTLVLQFCVAAVVFIVSSTNITCFTSSIRQFQYLAALESTKYPQWLLVSLFVTLPLIGEMLLDVPKMLWGTNEARRQWISFCGLNASLFIPTALFYFALHSNGNITAELGTYHLNLLVVQQACIVASLISFLYGPKLYHGTTEMQWNFQKSIERTSIHTLFFILGSVILFSLAFGISFAPYISWSLTVGSIVCLSIALVFVLFLSGRLGSVLIGIAWQQKRIGNHHQLFDLGMVLLLAMFCLGDFIIVIWATFGYHAAGALTSEDVLIAYTAMQILLTGLTGLLNGQRAKKQASFKNEKLQGRLNLIRYVSHEMRTPLNTAFMGLNILSNNLDLLKISCKADGCMDSFSERLSSASSCSTITTHGEKYAHYPVSGRSDMVYVGKQENMTTSTSLATETNASSTTQLDAYHANNVSFSRRVNTRDQNQSQPPLSFQPHNQSNASMSSYSIRSSTSDLGFALPNPHNASSASMVQQPQQYQEQRCLENSSTRSQQTSISLETVEDLYGTVQQISESYKVALSTLDDLLTFDKLDEQKLTIDKRETHPWAFLSTAAQPFRINALEAQVSMQIGASHVDSQWYDAVALDIDQFKLSQVVRNLLSNAIKFTPAGGKVSVLLEPLFDPAQLQFGSTQSSLFKTNDSMQIPTEEPLRVRLSVTDSGAGISAENQKKLFGQYVQFNANKLQKGRGSGLGLWITKSIVELHNGRISCQSAGEGQGSTFFIDLPVRRANVPSSVVPPILMTSDGRIQSDKKKTGVTIMNNSRQNSLRGHSFRPRDKKNSNDDHDYSDDDDELGKFDGDKASAMNRISSLQLSFFNDNQSNRAKKHESAMIDDSVPEQQEPTSSTLPNRSYSMLGDITSFLLGKSSYSNHRVQIGPRSELHESSKDPELGAASALLPLSKRPAFFTSATSPGTPMSVIACVDDSIVETPAAEGVSTHTTLQKPGSIRTQTPENVLVTRSLSLSQSPSHRNPSSTGSSPTRHLTLSANNNNRSAPTTPPNVSRLPAFLTSPTTVSPPSNRNASSVLNNSLSLAGYILPRNMTVAEKKLQKMISNNSSTNSNAGNASLSSASSVSSPSQILLLSNKPGSGFVRNLFDDKEKILEGEEGEEEDEETADSKGQDDAKGEGDGESTRAMRPDLTEQRLKLTLCHETSPLSKSADLVLTAIDSPVQMMQKEQLLVFSSVSPEDVHFRDSYGQLDGRGSLVGSPVLSLPSSVATTPQLTPQLTPNQHQQQSQPHTPLLSPNRLSPTRSPLGMRRSALGLVPDVQLQQSSRQNSRQNSPHPVPSSIIKTPPRAQMMTQRIDEPELDPVVMNDGLSVTSVNNPPSVHRHSVGVYDVDADEEESSLQRLAIVPDKENSSPTPLGSGSLHQDSMSSLDSQEMERARMRYANPSNPGYGAPPLGSSSSARHHLPRGSLGLLRQHSSQYSLVSSQDGTMSSYSTCSRSLSTSISRTNSRCLDIPSPRPQISNTVNPAGGTTAAPMTDSWSRSFSRSMDVMDAVATSAGMLAVQLHQPLSAPSASMSMDVCDEEALGSVMRSLLDSPEQAPPTTNGNQVLGDSNATWRNWDEGLNILVVDDSAPNRKICARLLSSKGHQVVEAVDGRHAIDVFHRLVNQQHEHVDVILLDDHMPNLSGPETASHLRRSAQFSGAIFGLTGDVEASAIQRFQSAGANSVLAKPLSMDLLRRCYDQFVESQGQ